MTIDTDEQILGRIQALTSSNVGPELWPDFPAYWDPSKKEGHNAADRAPPGAREPHCIFFFYFRIDTDGKLRVTHYFFQPDGKPITDLEACITLVAQYARDKKWNNANGQEPTMSKYANFKEIKFQRISYTVIFVDDVHWDFLLDSNYDPVIPFHKQKDGIGYHPNFSFYNARVHKIPMPKNGGQDTRHALSMLNLLLRESGDELGCDLPYPETEEQPFAFDLVLRVTFANADEYDQYGKPTSTDPSRLTVIFDPGGTNLGPPLPP